ncbi:MAG: hypothetical protein BWY09_01195 [Candidatus Hydrogenedentes bacterium ADurb.Bin179]|nr:MAG: hypothetical protein BWY09_01195 [Candidatus Hydrogenedentes bacterium ADurb.Bin179]
MPIPGPEAVLPGAMMRLPIRSCKLKSVAVTGAALSISPINQLSVYGPVPETLYGIWDSVPRPVPEILKLNTSEKPYPEVFSMGSLNVKLRDFSDKAVTLCSTGGAVSSGPGPESPVPT